LNDLIVSNKNKDAKFGSDLLPIFFVRSVNLRVLVKKSRGMTYFTLFLTGGIISLIIGWVARLIYKNRAFSLAISVGVGIVAAILWHFLMELMVGQIGSDANEFVIYFAGVAATVFAANSVKALGKEKEPTGGKKPTPPPRPQPSPEVKAEPIPAAASQATPDEQHILTLIRDGETKKALEALKDHDAHASILLSEYNARRRDLLANLISQEEWSRTQARINQAIIEIIS
jgi:uncharacterized membrane protein YeaQ/YmgE (transglycosylase-associated protein family)